MGGQVQSVGIPSFFGQYGTQAVYKVANVLLGPATVINFNSGANVSLNDGVLTVDISGGGSSVNVVDDLLSTSAVDALSANQGNVLGLAIAQLVLDLTSKANLASPTFTGTPSAPTQTQGTNSDALASTQFVNDAVSAAINALVSSSPAALDTLNELAVALNNDPNFATTVLNSVANKLAFDVVQTLTTPQKTNVFTSLGLQAGATAQNTDDLTEGESNKYFTDTRVLATLLAGLVTNDATVVAATDSVLVALGKLQKQASDLFSNQRYVILNDTTTAQTTYTVPASAITENGRTLIELTDNALGNITINAATGTGKVAGDSVDISIIGTYAAQVLVASGATLQGDLTFSYQHQTKTLIYKGSNVWKVVG